MQRSSGKKSGWIKTIEGGQNHQMGEDGSQNEVKIHSYLLQVGYVEENARIKASRKIRPGIYRGVLASSH